MEQTYRTDAVPYEGPVCIWCGGKIHQCGASNACEQRKDWWATIAGVSVSRNP